MKKCSLLFLVCCLPLIPLCGCLTEETPPKDPYQGMFDNGYISISLERLILPNDTEAYRYAGVFYNKINDYKSRFECYAQDNGRLKGKIRENEVELTYDDGRLVLYVSDYEYTMDRVENVP